ncbi:hypothetical protein [Nonomuraea aurantiaca]|uniref:hypothetical protein n=1 Tax=Nonomuraea aurantiaca TaxID=2878562 RepID=UPI001CDA2B23|nr:hypothetical protein [Nonomuraea aurantiaca]MCA2227506.1 hypothetical protein [Nonomuraea aurantiaca]
MTWLQRSQFGAGEMRQWYIERDVLPDGCESVIGEDSSMTEAVRRILVDADLTADQPLEKATPSPSSTTLTSRGTTVVDRVLAVNRRAW